MADPLIQLMMKADKVDAAQIEELFRRARAPVAAMDASEGPNNPDIHMAICPVEDPNYRSGVGIMLLNPEHEVLVGRRIASGGDAWQMPQGGIEDGERPYSAALRELREEVGTDNVELIAESKGWLRYDLPPELMGRAWGGRWRGQQQKWFAMRFAGSDSDINIATEHPEFSTWRWVPATVLPELIVLFKRQLYLDVLREFQGIHTAGR